MILRKFKLWYFKLEESYVIKVSYDTKIPELRLSWLFDLNLFKHFMNIFDKNKIIIYFIIDDLEYLLTKQNDFEEILKEIDNRLNFKIYCEWIVYQFRNSEYCKLLDDENISFIKIYKNMIGVCSNILFLNFYSTNSCLLKRMLKINNDISDTIFNFEEQMEDKKRWIYYKHWVFKIDENLNVKEELLYSSYRVN